jgi:hypothetical protein
MIVRVYFKRDGGEACVVKNAIFDGRTRTLEVSFRCCPDTIIVPEEEWDKNSRVRFYQ